MNSRLPRWSLVLLLVSPLCAAAEVRTWTDKQGQTTRGEFVRIHEGRVVLKVGTKTTLVPLSQFSQQDQEYIEGQVNRKANKDKDGDSQPVRIWTDARGNQILAAFSRMDATQVVLSESGRLRMIGFMEISQSDRTHIKDLLRGQGQEQLVAALESHEEEAAKAAAAAREAAAQNAAGQNPPRAGQFAPSIPRPPMSEASSALAEHMRQQEEARRQADERRRQEDQQRREESDRRMAESMERLKQEARERQQRSEQQRQEQTQQVQDRMAGLSASASGPTMVTEYRCSNCNKQVPDSIGAGGNCPHCGVYFEYTQSPSGQKQYASGSGSSSKRSGYETKQAVKAVVFLVILVCGGIAALWKKINGG